MSRKMKNSGIEWIGEIPDIWNMRKIFNVTSRVGSGTTPKGDEYYEGTVLWLNTGDLNDSIVDKVSKTVTNEAVKSISALKIFSKDSVVIAMYGATIGKL